MIKTTSELIAQLESGNNPFAVRYEPRWKYITHEIRDTFKRAHRGHHFSGDTINMILSTSWGKYQMMGSVLYEIGYFGQWYHFMTDEFLQQHYFDDFLVRRGINYELEELRTDERKRNKFALHYNGDKSGVYAARMLKLMGG